MPDFSAISDLLTQIKGLTDGITGVFGSLSGDGLLGEAGVFEQLGSIEAAGD